MVKQHLNSHKFRQLVLYIAQKSETDPTFGATKLNKLLFFCDFYAYAKFGRSLTGSEYKRLPMGPAPELIVQTRDALVQLHQARIERRTWHDYPQERLVPLVEPDMHPFSADEIALVDEIIQDLWDLNATATSNLSHEKMVGWQIVQDGEEIPYETVFLSAEPLTDEDIRSGQRLAAERGWLTNG